MMTRGSRMRWSMGVVALVAAMLPALSFDVSTTSPRGFEWSTFFIDGRFDAVEEASFELAAVVECAVVGVWFGGIGGAIGSFTCGIAGWA